MLSAASNALYFLLLLSAAVIVGIYLWMYAAHSFSIVVDESAAGIDEVKWPDLPIIDWAGKLFYLLWLVAVSALPVLVGIVPVAPEVLGGPFGVVPVFLGGVWLLFPIILLSSLSGTSKLYLLHIGMLRRMARRLGALFTFYLVSGVVLAAAGALTVVALLYPMLLPLAAPAGAAAFLIHARLVGRLACVIGAVPLHKRKKKRVRLPRALSVADPWAVPPEPQLSEEDALPEIEPEVMGDASSQSAPLAADAEEDEWTPHKRPYVVLGEGEIPKAPASLPAREPPAEPYAIRGEEPATSPAPTEAITTSDTLASVTVPMPESSPPLPEPIKPTDTIELWLYERDLPKPPKRPFLTGVFNFPCYPTVLRAWVLLSIFGMAWGGILSLMVFAAAALPE